MTFENSYLQSIRNFETVRVEMVCHGNICRSPMAAAMMHGKSLEIDSPNFVVTSSGTSAYHKGEGPHPLSQKTWENHGFEYRHKSQPFSKQSFLDTDLILVADQTNRAMILASTTNEADKAKVFMLRQFDPALAHIDPFGREAGELAIPDPWGYEIDAYEEVYLQIERAVNGLIRFFTEGRR
jgi:protein-tyrosine phosphatase